MNLLAERSWLPRLAAGGGFVLALLVFRTELASLPPGAVRHALASVEPGAAAAALVLATGALLALMAGERQAARRQDGPVLPPTRTAWAAFLGYAYSQALGSPLVGRPPVRDRLYTAWGLTPEEVDRTVTGGRVTILVGLPVVLGWALLGLPGATLDGVGTLSGDGLPARLLRLVGAGLLASVAFWAARVGRDALLRLAISLAYWLASAGALFVLLPTSATPGFGAFVAVFALAWAGGLLSRVPASLGVFEALLLLLLPGTPGVASVLAAILTFRICYQFIPLLVAVGTVAVSELGARREGAGRALSVVGSGVSSAVPLVLAGAVFLAGTVLLLTGALPVGPVAGRLPLPLVELSHFLGSVAGTLLLILAWGLARRLDAAFTATLVLLGLGALLAGLRGGGLAPATVLLLVLILLLPARKEFFRPATLTGEPLSPDWFLGVGVVLTATLWLGFFAYRDVALTGELWWEFALRGDASRFLRGSVGAAAVLLVYAGVRLLRTPEPDDPDPEGLPEEEVAAVVASSSRASANLVWLQDKRVLFSKGRGAFVMYGIEGRSWVSMGDPVGDPDDFDDLVWMFRSRTYRHGGWPVFYQATPACLPLYVDAGLNLLKLGEEAVVDVQGFGLEGGARSGMRKAVRKAEKDGVSFRVLARDEVATALPRLRAISDAWLTAKRAREKAFSLGAFSEAYLARFPMVVAEHEGAVVAFANLWLGREGTEFSLDLMRYDPTTSPQGVMQYLFARTLLWGKEKGYQRFSLGMAPLSGLEAGPLAPLSARLGAALYRHGEHFYNFQGLRAYKEKFDPVWEPRYLASPGGLALPRIVANIAALVSGGVRGVLGR